MGSSSAIKSPILQEEFWRNQAPQLTIGQPVDLEAIKKQGIETQLDRLNAQLQVEGYFQGEASELARLAPLLAAQIKSFHIAGISPLFIFLFDEAWTCFHALHPFISNMLGNDYLTLPDFWSWYIDPTLEEAGWKPHRDKGKRSLAEDGSPLSLTVWIPLTEAKPENGCIYLVPANRDPTYNTDLENNIKIDYPNIRALPAKPGECLCWNQAVLHWGSCSTRFAKEPRISMALEFQRHDVPHFNSPILPTLQNLGFEDRMQLIAKQLLQYQHMYALSKNMRIFAQAIIQSKDMH